MSVKYSNIQARIETQVANEVETILKNLGLTKSQAVSLFFHQINLKKKIPFEINMSNSNKTILDFPDFNSEEMKKLEATMIAKLYEGEEIPEYNASAVKPFVPKKK